MLTDFINTPCPVCDGTDFEFTYARKFRDRRFNYDNGILSWRPSQSIGSAPSVFIDPVMKIIKVVPWTKRDLMKRFRIMKECAASNHYRACTYFIESEFDILKEEGQLSVPAGRMYDHFYIRFNEGDDERVPEGGGSLNFTIDYDKKCTRVMTVDRTKTLPLVPLDRFDMKDPIGVVKKLESLMVLL